MSETLKQLLEAKVGFRNEDLSTGTYEIWDVIDYETKELENTDIFETCKTLYRTKNVKKVIEKHFQSGSTLYGLWLTTREGVLLNYAEEDETYISKYEIPDNALVISDIDDQGILFVLDVHPDHLSLDGELVEGTSSRC